MRFILGITILLFVLTASAQVNKNDTVRIYFDFAKAELTSKSKIVLNNLVNQFKSSSEIPAALKISGHCDYIGSATYNDALSAKRSNTVYNYLVQNGIPDSFFVLVKGHGENQPVADNTTASGRRENRRVEIILERNIPEAKDPQPRFPDEPIEEVPAPVTPVDTIPDFSKTTIDTAKEGQVLRLRNINFFGGRHTFLPQAMPALNELLAVMKAYPKLHIEIQGHICCVNGAAIDGLDFDAGDDQLSYNRARAVYYFLANNGISKRRMTFRGFGGQFPLVMPELTETDRSRNRRVEIKIIKNK